MEEKMRMRSGAIAVLLLMAGLASEAQTNTFPSSGNVGIGTTSPSTPLQIQSSYTSATAGFDVTEAFLWSNTTNFSTASYSPTDNRVLALTFDPNTGAPAIRGSSSAKLGFVGGGWYFSGGNVGVGTTTPLSRLHVDVGSGSTSAVAGLVYGSTQAGQFTGPAGNAVNAATLVVGSNWNNSNSSGAGLLNVYNASGSMLWVGNGGSVGIGTTTPGQKLEVNGNILLSTGSGGSITYPDGTTQSTAWTGSLCGGDYAESVDVAGDRHRYGPGDVLEIDDKDPSRFAKVDEPYSRAVAGVFSTKPGALGRRQTTPRSPDEVPLAMIGIVPVKVTAENGPIHPRDLLVSSSTLGYAMKGTDNSRLVGAVIGKAMGSLDKGNGVIEVLVTLQ